GDFTNVAVQAAGGLACWDGTRWSTPLPGPGEVWALEADEQGLLVGGRFSVPGWTNPVALARWDGSKWSVLNSELPPCTDPVVCVEGLDQVVAINGNVYGTIKYWLGQPSSLPGHILARCDANNNWSVVAGPDGNPDGLGYYHLARHGDRLVAAGNFTNTANPALRNIAAYDGTNWLALGEGLSAQVLALAASERFVYACCQELGQSGSFRYQIFRWDGTNWARLGGTFAPDAAYRIFVGPEESVYASGLFAACDDVALAGLARWDGERWQPVLNGEFHGLTGYTSIASCFAQHQDRMVVGGVFAATGNTVQSSVAYWSQDGWQVFGNAGTSGPPSVVRRLVSTGSKLFAGGSFQRIGGVAATNVACWDGVGWTNLAGGVNGAVNAMCWWREGLFVGGRFNRANGLAATNIARWQEGQWHSLGLGCNSNVNALAVWQDALYVAGAFSRAGNIPASRIARWDGTNWHPLGAGVGGPSNAEVRALTVGVDGLYVAGRFTLAGGRPITNIARWDGTEWFAVGTPPPGEGQALAVHSGELFYGVHQTDARGLRRGMVYHWDGTRWSPLGSGVIHPTIRASIFAIFVTEQEVFVGGLFTLAGDKPSVGIARWVRNPQVTLDLEPLLPEAAVRLRAGGDPGLRVSLETSADLVHWATVSTNSISGALWTIPVNPGAAPQFFRTRLVP
ncbi:MAG: hypothetical protein N2438_13965, partial [Limisphaera sp.]|nr:hypothetical protein [Limisphaera sp.]